MLLGVMIAYQDGRTDGQLWCDAVADTGSSLLRESHPLLAGKLPAPLRPSSCHLDLMSCLSERNGIGSSPRISTHKGLSDVLILLAPDPDDPADVPKCPKIFWSREAIQWKFWMLRPAARGMRNATE